MQRKNVLFALVSLRVSVRLGPLVQCKGICSFQGLLFLLFSFYFLLFILQDLLRWRIKFSESPTMLESSRTSRESEPRMRHFLASFAVLEVGSHRGFSRWLRELIIRVAQRHQCLRMGKLHHLGMETGPQWYPLKYLLTRRLQGSLVSARKYNVVRRAEERLEDTLCIMAHFTS